MKGKVLPFLVHFLSTLSSCNHSEEHPTSALICRENVQRSVLVSTVDGSLTALDAGGGHTLWSFSSLKGPLFSSSLVHKKGSPHFIPGLDSFLYVLENDKLQQLPITADMLMNDDFHIKGSFLVGSKERAVYGLNALTGEMLYSCEADKCVRFSNDSVISLIDTLKVTREHIKVRGADSITGESQWEFTVGRYKLGLLESHGDVESCAVSDMEVELGMKLEVDVLTGRIQSVSKATGAIFWTKQFTSPIAEMWGMNGGKLQKFSLYNLSATNTLPHGNSRLLGSYNGQLYVHPALPGGGGDRSPLLTTTHKGSPRITADYVVEYSLVRPSAPPSAVGESEVALYDQSDYKHSITEGPAGHGVYFCTNISSGLSGPLALLHNKVSLDTCMPSDTSLNSGECTVSTEQPVKPNSIWLSMMLNPWIMSAIIVLLCLVVFRSRMKRKILEKDIEQLRQQSSAQTPSTPLHLSTVVSQLVAEGRVIPGMENMDFVRRSASKSESSDNSLHPVESESRFKVDFEPCEELGRGGFGVVYKCKHKVDGGDYAVKRIKLPMKDTGREKVMREVRALAQLEHPNIVRYFSAWVERGDMVDVLGVNTVTGVTDSSYSHGTGSLVSGSNVSSSCVFIQPPTPVSPRGLDSHILPPLKEFVNDKSKESSFTVEFEEPSFKPSEGDSSHIVFEREDQEHDDVPGDSEVQSEEIGSSADVATTNVSQNISCGGELPLISFLFIQMQLCQKESLKEWLRLNVVGRSRKTVLFYFEQILNAVCYVHSKGMMHRDLKPSNIFFSFDGSIKIGDFGLVAGDFDEYEQIQPALQQPESVSRSVSDRGRTGNIGTRLYMSPEQMQEDYVYDQKVDIFSLGIILYELNHPFATQMERTKVLEGVRKCHIRPEFANKLQMEHDLVTWLLSEDPLKRPKASEISSSERLAKLKVTVASLSSEEDILDLL